MHNSVTEMWTHVHISATKWCVVGYETGVLWDLRNMSIALDGDHDDACNIYKLLDNVFIQWRLWRDC